MSPHERLTVWLLGFAAGLVLGRIVGGGWGWGGGGNGGDHPDSTPGGTAVPDFVPSEWSTVKVADE